MTGLSTDTETDLRHRALDAARNGYAPYSNAQVGAALFTENNQVFSGCNVENASYGLTMCAERAAVFAAVLGEGSKVQIRAIALASDDPRITSPCGACRQVLAEFGRTAAVLLPNGQRTTVAELLPNAFGFP